jgi:small subunit ribosomal protein S1
MWGRVSDATQIVFNPEVEVVVEGVDSKSGNLTLSMKTPANNPLRNYRPRDRVHGRVTRIENYGVLIQLEHGLTGLLHRNEIPASVAAPRIRDEIEAYVLSVDEANFRLALTLRH